MVRCVGVTGASRSGKSTLCRGIKDSVQGKCVVVAQDQYFIKREIKRQQDWEYDKSLDHDALLLAVEKAARSMYRKDPDGVVLVEGFRVLVNERLAELLDVVIWLDIPRDVCRERRAKSNKPVSDSTFNEHLWPQHEAYAAAVIGRAGPRIVHLDATRPERDVAIDAVNVVYAAPAIQAASRALDTAADEEAGGRVAVLTLCGSLCPVTTGHTDMLHQARDHVLAERALGLAGAVGLVTLNAQRHVENKFKRLGEKAPEYLARRKLTELAISHSPWLAIEGHGFRTEGRSLKGLRLAFPRFDFLHFLVNGADDVDKYAKFTSFSQHALGDIMRRPSHQQPARMICMGRPGYTQRVVYAALAAGVDLTAGYFIIGPEMADISATQARNILRDAGTPTEGKLKALEAFLNPAVAAEAVRIWGALLEENRKRKIREES